MFTEPGLLSFRSGSSTSIGLGPVSSCRCRSGVGAPLGAFIACDFEPGTEPDETLGMLTSFSPSVSASMAVSVSSSSRPRSRRRDGLDWRLDSVPSSPPGPTTSTLALRLDPTRRFPAGVGSIETRLELVGFVVLDVVVFDELCRVPVGAGRADDVAFLAASVLLSVRKSSMP